MNEIRLTILRHIAETETVPTVTYVARKINADRAAVAGAMDRLVEDGVLTSDYAIPGACAYDRDRRIDNIRNKLAVRDYVLSRAWQGGRITSTKAVAEATGISWHATNTAMQDMLADGDVVKIYGKFYLTSQVTKANVRDLPDPRSFFLWRLHPELQGKDYPTILPDLGGRALRHRGGLVLGLPE